MFAQETSVQPTTLIEEVEYEIYEVQKRNHNGAQLLTLFSSFSYLTI